MKSLLLFAFVGSVLCEVSAAAQGQPDAILCWQSRSLGPRSSLIVDLRLHSGNDNRRPTAEDSASVARVGGRILHGFNVAVLRVALDTGGLRALIQGRAPVADVAYPVGDTTRLDVWAQVFFLRRMTPADDSVLRSIGGAGLLHPPSATNVSLTIPDSMISRVADLPNVAFVRAQAMFCAVANSQTVN